MAAALAPTPADSSLNAIQTAKEEEPLEPSEEEDEAEDEPAAGGAGGQDGAVPR